jgi:dienelactone hydrolase
MSVPSATSLPSATPLYLDRDGADSVFAIVNRPAAGERRDLAVLICPPFGWDDICSYRSRRALAERLAGAGYTTLRIDFPGTGDSGGSPEDPGRVRAWTNATVTAASWLSVTGDARRTAAVGIGLGGLVICRALAEGAPIDDLVLWATPARGRAFVRELHAFARLENFDADAPGEVVASRLGKGSLRAKGSPRASGSPRVSDPSRASGPSRGKGSPEAGGFALSPETTRALEKLDVSALTLPSGRELRALLLERDGIGVDKRLRSSLEAAGADVTVAPGTGYGAMMAKPHLARSPSDTFERVLSWLEQGPAPIERQQSREPSGERRTAEARQAIELTIGGVGIRETPLQVEQPFGSLFGILVEPVGAPTDLCVVMLNAGAIRRIGPNRMWVDIARRWAARGVPTLRLDLEGIGDADGDADRFTRLSELYMPELVDQVCAALDVLQARGVGRRFALTGLCAGAFWSFHAALRDERVAAAFMLNPRALFWDPSQETARDFRRGLLRRSSWRQILRGEVALRRMLTLAIRAPFALPIRTLKRWYARRRGDDELDRALDRLRDTHKQIEFVFSGNEPLQEELQHEGRLDRLDRWPNVRVEYVPGRDHSMRPFESQRCTGEVLDRALDRALRSGETRARKAAVSADAFQVVRMINTEHGA